MSKFRFKLDKRGVGQLLNSDEMLSVVEQYGNNVKNRCGDGYNVSSAKGKERVHANVYAESKKAKKDNLNNNTLLRSLK